MDKIICSCLICRKELVSRGLHCHIDRAHLGKTQYSNGNNGKYKKLTEYAEQRKIKAELEYCQHPKTCPECSKILDFAIRKNKFCSHQCSAKASNNSRKQNGFTLSVESRQKISKTLLGRVYPKKIKSTLCQNCNTSFVVSDRRKKFCSSNCRLEFRTNIKNTLFSDIKVYRAYSRFDFALNNFPDEFDFSLIEKYGWYSPSNKKNNLSGVSRDHMVSVRFGLENNIDPKIIAHPANCHLMVHSQNISKGTSSSIPIEELYERIEKWDIKYPKINEQ